MKTLASLVIMAAFAVGCVDNGTDVSGSPPIADDTVPADTVPPDTVPALEELPPGTIETWVNQTGLTSAADVWPARIARACSEGVWEPSVAQSLAIEFIDEDGPADAYLSQPGNDEISLQEEAAGALWTMAVQVCRDDFPQDALDAGPFFNFEPN